MGDGLFVILYGTMSHIVFATIIVMYIAKFKKFSDHLNRATYLYGIVILTYFIFWQEISFSIIILSSITLVFSIYILFYMVFKKFREAQYS